MVRVLRNLKISEVSSVDKAANEGARIVLWKRDDTGSSMAKRLDSIFKGDDENNGDDEKFAAVLRFLLHHPRGSDVIRRFFPRGVSDPQDIEQLARLVASALPDDALQAEPDNDARSWPDAADVDPADVPDVEKHAQTRRDASKRVAGKGFSMPTRNEVLRAVMKAHGNNVVSLAKHIVAQGASDISEHELTSLVVEQAKRDHPDMSDAQAFSKLFTDTSPSGELLRRAIAVAKGFPPVADEAPTTADSNELSYDAGDPSGGDRDNDALKDLERRAEALRRKTPSMSFAQAFARTYADERNAHLVARERRQNRPDGVQRAAVNTRS